MGPVYKVRQVDPEDMLLIILVKRQGVYEKYKERETERIHSHACRHTHTHTQRENFYKENTALS